MVVVTWQNDRREAVPHLGLLTIASRNVVAVDGYKKRPIAIPEFIAAQRFQLLTCQMPCHMIEPIVITHRRHDHEPADTRVSVLMPHGWQRQIRQLAMLLLPFLDVSGHICLDPIILNTGWRARFHRLDGQMSHHACYMNELAMRITEPTVIALTEFEDTTRTRQ